MNYDELMHAGIKGMKWGVRRYQNKDGSLTALGRIRYGAGKAASSISNKIKQQRTKKALVKAEEAEAERWNALMRKPISKLTNAELAERQARRQKERDLLNVEKQISDLSSEPENIARRIAKKAVNDVAIPALVDAGRTLMTNKLKSLGLDALGLKNDLKVKPKEDNSLEEAVKRLSLEKRYKELTKDTSRESSGASNSTKSDSNSSSAKSGSNSSSAKPIESNISPENTDTPKRTASNSNSTSVSNLSSSGYKMTSIEQLTGSKISNSGAESVNSLRSSGYHMTPINQLTSSNTSRGRSISDDFLNNVGDWKMRSLDDIEKYN